MSENHSAPAVYAQALTDLDRPTVAVDSLADYLERLREVQARIRTLTGEADAIKAAIQDCLGDYEVGTVHGLPAVTWTHHTRHALDQAALKKNEPALYGAYLKASTVRRFTVIEGDQP